MLDRPAAERSEVTVERLVAAAAIPIGRTNLPEFAFQGYTDSKLFGPARNPWGLEWSPGGSSGGSSAARAPAPAPSATARARAGAPRGVPGGLARRLDRGARRRPRPDRHRR